jgi:hypothetical protein
MMTRTIPGEAKERSKDTQPQGPKKRERASLSRGRKLSHPGPPNVNNIQIVRSNSNIRFRILTCCLKNWCQKTRIYDLSIVYCEKNEHTP